METEACKLNLNPEPSLATLYLYLKMPGCKSLHCQEPSVVLGVSS